MLRAQKITFSLPAELNKKIKEYCTKYQYGQGEFLRDLIRNKLYGQTPIEPPRPNKNCKVCKLPKGDMVEGICFDCFDTLPDNFKLNYHPIQP